MVKGSGWEAVLTEQSFENFLKVRIKAKRF